MNKILTTGISVVNLALLSYTLFFIKLVRYKKTGKLLLGFLMLGLIFDIFSTICMIVGSPNVPLTLHGIIGYIALLGMLTDAIFIGRFTSRNGTGANITQVLFHTSLLFYIYWIATYITGMILVML